MNNMRNIWIMVLASITAVLVILSMFSILFGISWLASAGIITAAALLFFVYKKAEKSFTGRSFWWEFFKEIFAVPIGWVMLHVMFITALPKAAEFIWNYQTGYLIVFELAAFTLNIILSKRILFEERWTRKFEARLCGLFIVISVSMTYGWMFHSEFVSKIDWTAYDKMTRSSITFLDTQIKIEDRMQKRKPLLEKLELLYEISKERPLTKAEFIEIDSLKKQAKESYAPKEMVNWSKEIKYVKKKYNDWFNSKAQAKETVKKRKLSGLYLLPPDKSVDTGLHYHDKEYIEMTQQQMGSNLWLGVYMFENEKIPSVRIDRKFKKLRATSPGTVKMTNIGDENIYVEVKIRPRRS